MKPIIAVIGGETDVSEESLDMAEEIGSDIARNDCILVCGGRGGIMEAACRGAKAAGGLTVGILPSLDKREANKFVDIPLSTGLGYARNSLVVSCADAVIALEGRVGTLSEIGMSLCNNRPVVVVKGSGGVSDFLESGRDKLEFGERIHVATLGTAVDKVLDTIKKLDRQ
ncbi:MAG: TIGR00725 family protein [Candidatus Altiarchaeales archaeon ex4484_2]|nr:MAG: TIGR00725 family protein [Candidatus Altiarchaeales archaeon ex4484_2]